MSLSNTPPFPPARWVIMGVSGCGKSEIGARLAAHLGIPLVEGDVYHPPANIAKMAAGVPLNDDDRHGWLLILQQRLRAARCEGISMVLSCSALKRSYRDLLRQGDPDLIFVHLAGSPDVIANRMAKRSGHFMPLSLLESQLRDLQPPAADERALQLDIDMAPEAMVEEILRNMPSTGKEQA